jgi:hypothetical protein
VSWRGRRRPRPAAFLRHIRSLREHGIRSFFSVGAAVNEPVRAAIIAHHWPWVHELVTAFARLAALHRPIG